MKFSYPFLRKLFPGTPSKEKTEELLNLHAFEVESIEGDAMEIKLPANRYSDCASHVGVAREIAAITGAKLNYRTRKTDAPLGRGLIEVRVDEPEACPRYAARVFEIPAMERSSKDIERVLTTCGLRPVNAIVDIMNYAMLETGQPLHAFDYDKLAGGPKKKTIVVRMAKKGEAIETLDGQSFSLTPDTLVIADEKQAQAIAGIKGGAASGVSGTTKRIVVEAANFDAALVFRASRRLKFPTDAAARFSHGISPALVDWGMERATELLIEAGARLVDSAEALSVKIADAVIEFDCARYASVIGASVEPRTAALHFERLGFDVQTSKAGSGAGRFAVRIPAWRNDIENVEGLIEEVARLEGYGALAPQPPTFSIVPPHEENDVALKEKMRKILVNLRLNEVYGSSFVPAGEVAVENPIADDKKYLRSALVPLLVDNIKENARFFDDVRIFEVGKVFMKTKGKIAERPSLGIALGAKKNPRLVLELKGLVTEFLEGLGISDILMSEWNGEIHVSSDGVLLGTIGHRTDGKQWSYAFAEFDLEKVLAATEEEREYVPLKKFPAVVRDLSVLVTPATRIGDVMEAIEEANEKLIEATDLVDEYRDEKLSGRQSLTFRIVFQADDRTLTDEEVNREMGKIETALKQKFKAEIR